MTRYEIWMVLDENGDYSAGEDRDVAIERHKENIGSVAGARLIPIIVNTNPPKPVEVTVVVDDATGETVTAETE